MELKKRMDTYEIRELLIEARVAKAVQRELERIFAEAALAAGGPPGLVLGASPVAALGKEPVAEASPPKVPEDGAEQAGRGALVIRALEIAGIESDLPRLLNPL